MTSRMTGAITVLAGIGLLVLTGCTSTPAPSPAATATASPTPTPRPTPTTSTPPTAAADCATVFTDDENAELASDGLTPRDPPSPLGPVMQEMIAQGGVGCQWGDDSADDAVWFAQVPLTPAEVDQAKNLLNLGGFDETSDPLQGSYRAPDGYDANYRPLINITDGVMYFVSEPRLLTSVAGLQ